MSFPMEYPIFQFFFWLLNTSGLGGLFIVLFAAGLGLVAFLVLRWVEGGRHSQETVTYAYPTPSLHEEHTE